MKKIKSSFRSKILFLLLLVFILSCDNENFCEMPLEGESYFLSDAIKSYTSNYINAERIIFKTDMGEEVSFTTSNFKDTLAPYQFGSNCEIDTTLSQTVKGTSQLIQFTLFNPIEISNPIFISLLEVPRPNSSEIKESVTITLGDYFSNSLGEGNFLFEYYANNNSNPFVTSIDSIELNGKMFYSVFEASNLSPTPTLEIKYTKNEGVIFIKNTDNGKEYIYERKE